MLVALDQCACASCAGFSERVRSPWEFRNAAAGQIQDARRAFAGAGLRPAAACKLHLWPRSGPHAHACAKHNDCNNIVQAGRTPETARNSPWTGAMPALTANRIEAKATFRDSCRCIEKRADDRHIGQTHRKGYKAAQDSAILSRSRSNSLKNRVLAPKKDRPLLVWGAPPTQRHRQAGCNQHPEVTPRMRVTCTQTARAYPRRSGAAGPARCPPSPRAAP